MMTNKHTQARYGTNSMKITYNQAFSPIPTQSPTQETPTSNFRLHASFSRFSAI